MYRAGWTCGDFQRFGGRPGSNFLCWYTNGILCSGATNRASPPRRLIIVYTNVLVTASNLNGSVSNSPRSPCSSPLRRRDEFAAENIQPQSASWEARCWPRVGMLRASRCIMVR